MSPPLLVVSRYLPEDIAITTEGIPELVESEKNDDSMDKFNHPRVRRGLILHELKARQGTNPDAIQFVKPDTAATTNDGMKCYENVQSPGLIDFLSTGWEQWDAMGPEGQDPFASMGTDNSSGTPPLVPGNVPLPREPYQRPSQNVMGKIGYYCTDTCTPIFANLKGELLWDVAVMQKAIDHVQDYKTVYALATHPGHHAAQDSFGGYCYLNHAAFAARKLQSQYGYGKVAVLDVDYHCGNGTASIFYDDPSVLVISIHCHPDYDYPFHSGFEDEIGIGEGQGATLHLPLLPQTTWKEYSVAMEQAMKKIQSFGAEALVVSLGLDTLDGDPCAIRRAGFLMSGQDYVEMGQWIGSYANTIPILVVQEGGYRMDKVPIAASDVIQSCAASK